MTEVRTLHPTPEQHAFAFGGREPLLTVTPGTVVELSTEDCYGGQVRSTEVNGQPWHAMEMEWPRLA